MPDEFGKLTQADYATISRWWEARWKGPVICPICKTAEWSTASHVVVHHRLGANWAADGTAAYPMILVSCNNCAHTLSFSAVSMGVSAPYDVSQDQSMIALPPPKGAQGG